jgi:RHS repeat-associated protein
VYGFGRVSADGRRIEPEIDPATGRPYGLPDFSWHFPDRTPEGNPSPPDTCPVPRTSDTVDLATGIKIEAMTDLSFGGARGGIALTRVYTSELARNCDACPFGQGWTHNYAVRLTGSFQQNGAGRVVLPEQVNGRLFNYARTDGDGALVFSTSATTGQLGDVVRKLANGTFEYRYAAGNLMRFDSTGRLTALVDRNENTTTLTYTGQNLTQITDPVGRSVTLDYDSSNRIIRATDPSGRTWSYTYEGTSNGLTAVTDPLTHVMRYDYVVGGRLSRVTDKRGIVTKEITYDTNGRVIRQRFADGGIEHYSYVLAGRVVTLATMSDPLGRTTRMRFNPSGYVIGTTDALGQNSLTERDLTTSLPTSVTGPCGCAEVHRQFDERGNVIASTDRLGQTEHHEYEPVFNKLTRLTDRLGRATTYGYDARGNLTSVTDASNQTMSFGYDQFGALISVTDPLGHTSRVEYNTNGDLVAAVDALGNRTALEYDGLGRATAAADPLSRRATLAYDSLDRVVGSTNAAGGTTVFGYDPNGNLSSVTDPKGGRWVTVYDARNRPVSTADPLGRVTRSEYNASGELITSISPSGRTVRYGFDLRGQVISIIDPLAGVVRLTYDNRQNLIAVSDQRGNTTTLTYDELSRPVIERDPLGRSSSIGYDPNGNMVEIRDRLGRTVGFNYDTLDRLTRASYVDAVVDYIYDAASKLVRINDTQGGQISWSYDDAGRVTSETTSAGILSYAYNAAGQRVSMTAAGRPPVNYAFDLAGRVRSIIQGQETFRYDYDALSRRTSLQRPNGVTTSYSYDDVSRLSRLSHAQDDNPSIESYEYTYNVEDEITSITSIDSSPVLPGTKTASVADGANRLGSFGGSTLRFDLEGQTISKTNVEGVTTYQWDGRGRLIQVGLPDSRSISYGYDALGRRSSRTEGAVTTTFLYDGDDVVLDRGTDLSTVDYINGARIDEKLRLSGSTGPLYFLQDHTGSTTAMLAASGAVAERGRYEPFGLSTTGILTRYGFTGRERDSATGLMYYRARWYDAEQGRFTSEDPLGFGAGLNLYEYGMNDPVGNSDPSGLLTIVIPGTDYKPDDWYKPGVLQRVENTFCEHAHLWTKGWSGGNYWQDRKRAAKALAEFINSYAFAPGETLNIVAHSHGGNIAFEASWLLNRPIDNLVTLGTPIRGDYALNPNRIGRHIHGYSDNDQVQVRGGYGAGYLGGDSPGTRLPVGPPGEQGPAGRRYDGKKTTNLNLTYLVSDGPAQSHTDLWKEAAPWEKQIRPAIDSPECICKK